MNDDCSYPDSNRLSVLTAMILLVYAVIPWIDIPTRSLAIELFGITFSLPLNSSTLLSLLVAVMAGAGSDWLLQGHPKYVKTGAIQHWIFPAFTAWAIGIPLNNLEVSLAWWAVFGFGGLLLILVLVAEYLVVDVTDARNTLASVFLTATSFGLFLILAISVRNGEMRLYLTLPSLALGIAAVCLRTLYLRLGGRWCFGWSIAVSVVVGQIVIGLHYWPLQPLSFGLFLSGPAYALTSLAGALEEGQTRRTFWIEPDCDEWIDMDYWNIDSTLVAEVLEIPRLILSIMNESLDKVFPEEGCGLLAGVNWRVSRVIASDKRSP